MCLSSSSSHTEQLRVQAWGTPAGAGWLGWLRGLLPPVPRGAVPLLWVLRPQGSASPAGIGPCEHLPLPKQHRLTPTSTFAASRDYFHHNALGNEDLFLSSTSRNTRP